MRRGGLKFKARSPSGGPAVAEAAGLLAAGPSAPGEGATQQASGTRCSKALGRGNAALRHRSPALTLRGERPSSPRSCCSSEAVWNGTCGSNAPGGCTTRSSASWHGPARKTLGLWRAMVFAGKPCDPSGGRPRNCQPQPPGRPSSRLQLPLPRPQTCCARREAPGAAPSRVWRRDMLSSSSFDSLRLFQRWLTCRRGFRRLCEPFSRKRTKELSALTCAMTSSWRVRMRWTVCRTCVTPRLEAASGPSSGCPSLCVGPAVGPAAHIPCGLAHLCLGSPSFCAEVAVKSWRSRPKEGMIVPKTD